MATPQFYTGDEDESEQAQDAASSGHAGQEEEASPQQSPYSGELGPVHDGLVERTREHSGQIVSLPLSQLTSSPLPPIQAIRDHATRRLTDAGIPDVAHVAPNARQDSQPAWRDLYRPNERHRAYDRARTGRDWPGSLPQSDTEALLMQQLCFAPGQVPPSLLARVYARRFVRAARSRHVYDGDKLAKTDIAGIAYFGLDLEIETFPFRRQPRHAHALAYYHSQQKLVRLDDVLVREPPEPDAWRDDPRYPHSGHPIEPYAWRDAIDATWAGRFLLAWCCALYLTQIASSELTIGFVPKLPPQGFAERDTPGDLNRHALAMIACAELLAPRERLQRQIAFLFRDKLPQQQVAACCGDQWQAAVSYYGAHLFDEEAERCRQEQRRFDPIAYFLWILATYNACPQLLVERSLNDHRGIATPQAWSERLLRELSYWLCPSPQVGLPNRYRQALATYETQYGFVKRFGRQPLTLTLAL